ncbi:MAG: nuclear transport factor 2 family protein [Leptolyngbya sp. SIO4C1]|nr:nuclear transport factor 2 family protein [Leptolyngbya sp. SIO4C1]
MTFRRPWQVLSLGIAGLSACWATQVNAASPETAPAELVSVLEQLETAANAQNLDQVMSFYDESFTNEDGFTQVSLRAALDQLWQEYETLTYRIELQSWDSTDSGYVAETVTYIDGTRLEPRTLRLESVIRSRQQFEDNQVVSQEILSERNQLNAGENPPTVTVLLPERVSPGERYPFDAIVQEPLGERYLLGAALDEGVTAEDFFTARPLDLELLTAGGLFKVGNAPAEADNLWVSALLIRDDGLVVVTRRLRVE